MPTRNEPALRVLIVGAGIAGLTLAAELARRGHRPLVLERAVSLRDAGYMIDFFGPGYDAAERMGLLPSLAEIHYPIARFAFLGADGTERFALPYPALRRRLFADRHFNFMRGELARVLFERIRDHVDVRFATTITRFALAADGVSAALSDGTEVTADLLVGADGVNSDTRRALFGDDGGELRYMGYDTAAYVIDDPQLRSRLGDAFAMLTADDRQVSAYPIRSGAVATFFLQRRATPFAERSPDAIRRELHRVFGDLDWLVAELLAGCTATCEPYYDAVSQVVLPHWSRGRATLVGDACQCVSLLAGQGASLAMAGAYVLAEELSGGGGVDRALARYEARMRPLAERKQAEGRRTASWFIPRGRARAAIRDWALRLSLLPGVAALVRRRLLGDRYLPPPTSPGR